MTLMVAAAVIALATLTAALGILAKGWWIERRQKARDALMRRLSVVEGGER
jgi:hypothetical protein